MQFVASTFTASTLFSYNFLRLVAKFHFSPTIGSVNFVIPSLLRLDPYSCIDLIQMHTQHWHYK
jgi:hypothetical protein